MKLKIITYEDGNIWCCKLDNDLDIQESVSGFEETPEEAMKNFAHDYFYGWR